MIFCMIFSETDLYGYEYELGGILSQILEICDVSSFLSSDIFTN